jgi:hypothetical protein
MLKKLSSAPKICVPWRHYNLLFQNPRRIRHPDGPLGRMNFSENVSGSAAVAAVRTADQHHEQQLLAAEAVRQAVERCQIERVSLRTDWTIFTEICGTQPLRLPFHMLWIFRYIVLSCLNCCQRKFVSPQRHAFLTSPLGQTLTPRGKVVPQGWICPLGVKLSPVRSSILLNNEERGGERRGELHP